MALRIGFLTYVPPAPANSGALLRAYRLARSRARLGSVHLYCMASEAVVEKLVGHEDLQVYARVRLHPIPREATASLGWAFHEPAIAHWTHPDPPLSRLLLEDHRQQPYDVLVAQQLFTANVGQAVPGVPLVLDEHNIESQALAQMFASLPYLEPGQGRPQVQAVSDYERRAWGTANRITCVTEADAQYIRAHCSTPVQVVPNGVALREVPFTLPSRRQGQEVLFVGAFLWPPNIKAARFLAKEVMPRVWQEEPSAKLVLCGSRPVAHVVLLQRRGIEVTGTVPSVVPYLGRAAVFANALSEGSGSSLKVLEALAAGLPLVSTAVGVRGFALAPSRHYLPAEDAEGFAQAIVAVLRERASFDAQAREGRTFAEGYDWDRVGGQFAALVAAAARGGDVRR